MTARKTVAKKPTVPEGAISVADLPDNKAAQVSEAMEKDSTFVLGDGSEVTFKPLAEWSFKANKAFAIGDVEAWMRGALADPRQLDTLLDRPSREVGRIIRYYDDMAGATRGEERSSSTS